MSTIPIDTPDGQVGTVTAGQLLATVPANTASVSVSIPANAAVLAIIMPEALPGTTIYVEGNTSSITYPTYLLPVVPPFYSGTMIVVPVQSSIDSAVTVTFGTAPTVSWYVVAAPSYELLTATAISTLIAKNAETANPAGFMALGSDGTDARTLSTDASGNLNVNIISGGGGSLTYLESFITSQVSLTASTPTNIASLSLASGTWLIIGRLDVQQAGTTNTLVDAWLGPTSASIASAYAATSAQVSLAGGGGEFVDVVITKVVQLTATTTVYLEVEVNQTGARVNATTQINTIGNVSGLTAVKIG